MIPLIFGLLHAPLLVGTMGLAEVILRLLARVGLLDAVLPITMLGWSVLLGEAAYRLSRDPDPCPKE